MEIEQMEEPANGILIDLKNDVILKGIFSGSIITRINDYANSIIFSDSIEISDEFVIIEGLKVGYKGKLAISNKGKYTFRNHNDILYSVKINEEITQMFDSARFNTSFPYMISHLNTSILFNSLAEEPINHIDFVRGEILNHPIGLLFNDSIIIGDRMVIDFQGYPVFYDSILISRKSHNEPDDDPIDFSYEPIRRLDINYIKYLIILGVEMLR